MFDPARVLEFSGSALGSGPQPGVHKIPLPFVVNALKLQVVAQLLPAGHAPAGQPDITLA
jgi:hypothetical protein